VPRNQLICPCGERFTASRSDAIWCENCKRERQKARHKKWLLTHPQDLAAHRISSQKWKDKNRERVRAEGREYVRTRSQDPEWLRRQREVVQRYRLADPERASQIRRRSYNKHAEKRRAETRERYRVERHALYERDGGRCHICGRKVSRKAFHVDHLIPRSKGGPTVPANLAIAHPFCNQSRSAGRIPAQLRLVA
jgi:5-methylcytosine-specific restriction endonuclease McrA